MKRTVFIAIFVLFLGNNALADDVRIGKTVIELPEDLDAQTVQLIKEKAPQIAEVCPGFSKYESELTLFRIQNNPGYDVNISFKVPEKSSIIPQNFYAYGHTCYYGISRNGKVLTISKKGCKAICAGKAVSHVPNPWEIPLN